MAQVILKNVSKIFDKNIVAVNDISLEIADKEFMVIVGPSGCGKTTTLRLIAGLEELSGGDISIGDTLVNNVPPKNRDIAMVFQNYALYPHMTVYQNMAFGLKLRKYPKDEIEKRVRDAAELLGIEELLARKPKALSGGQRQRVAVGRAIVRNPKAFLFDEPLSNLDAKLRVTTRAELKALHHRLQTTSIYVTHDQVEAMTLGDRICVMYEGSIHQLAAPLEVYDRPVNRFVAGFLGSPPMNFFEGKIQFIKGLPEFVGEDCKITLPERMKTILADYADKEMTLGVRPEDVGVAPFGTDDGNYIHAEVLVIEPLGDKMDVYLTSDSGGRFIANVEPHVKIKVDDKVKMYVNTVKVHVFEPGDTGINVSLAVKE